MDSLNLDDTERCQLPALERTLSPNTRSRVKKRQAQQQVMSTDSDTNHDASTGTTITLTREEKWWVAKDEQTGVVSQGKTRQAALENLDEALEGNHGDGEQPTEDDLRELGIDPEHNTSGSLADSDVFE